jgi:hypothetical protein
VAGSRARSAEESVTTSVARPATNGLGRRALIAVALVASACGVVLTDTPFCPLALFAGIPCPGCGLTRATFALLHGDLRGALGFHPLVLVLSPLFAAAMLKVLVDYVRGSELTPTPAWWTGRAVTWLATALLVAVVGVWLLRFAGWLGGPVPVQSLVR